MGWRCCGGPGRRGRPARLAHGGPGSRSGPMCPDACSAAWGAGRRRAWRAGVLPGGRTRGRCRSCVACAWRCGRGGIAPRLRRVRRQGAAQHDDLAKIVAARLVPFEPLQASCFAVPRAAQFLQPLVEWARLGIVRGFTGGEYADVRGSEIGAVAGEYVDPLLTRLRHVGCDEMGDVAGASGAPSQLALERSRDVLNGGELVGGERLDEELADGP
jgi:hypothetical protein